MKTNKLMALITLFMVFAFSCATTKTTAKLTDISEVIGKELKLVEVRVNNKTTDFDRETLKKEGFGEIFTIKIDKENISGVGAPNRYSSPYTVSEDDPLAVKIGVVRSTMMAALYQPEKLKEHDFFVYVQNTYKWGILDGKLELHSKNDNGDAVVMYFTL